LRNIVRRQGTLPVPQVGPTLLDFGKPKRVQPFRFMGFTRTQAEALLALAYGFAKIVRKTFSETSNSRRQDASRDASSKESLCATCAHQSDGEIPI
jgi:hypothetical protein